MIPTGTPKCRAFGVPVQSRLNFLSMKVAIVSRTSWLCGALGVSVVLVLVGLIGWTTKSSSQEAVDSSKPLVQPGVQTETISPQAFLAGLPSGRKAADADKVLTNLSARLEKTPSDSVLWAALGDALMQKARETADSAYYTHAERAYRVSLSHSPNDKDGLIGMAWVAGSRHQFESSIDWAEQAIAKRPDDPNPYGLIGDAEMEIGNYDTAGIRYQKMLDIRPDQASYCRGAQWLFVTGDTKQALWLMRKAVEVGGRYTENTAWCIAQMALMHFNIGALLPAEQQVATALQKAPNNYHLLLLDGRIKTARGDNPGAIAALEKAFAVAPQHDVIVALEDRYRSMGQLEKAKEYEALVDVTHKLNQANGVLGDSQLARYWADHDKNLPQALELAEAEYRTRKNVVAVDTLAWCLHKNGRHQEAGQMIQLALKRKTPDAMILFHAGMIHAAVGKRADATQYLFQAVNTNPYFHPTFVKTATDTLAKLSDNAAVKVGAR